METEPTRLYAHTPNKSGKWHDLLSHLSAVATRAKDLGEKFDTGDVAYWAGLLHDIGKLSPQFQEYLRACDRAKENDEPPPTTKVDHSTAGAILCSQRHADFLAFVLAGHHGGMQDRSELIDRMKRKGSDPTIEEAFRRAQEIDLYSTLSADVSALLPAYISRGNKQERARRIEFLSRMLFSALVDADFLDTEAHYSPEQAQVRAPVETVQELWRRFEQNQDTLMQHAPDTPVNRARCEMYQACIDAADSPQGIFSLSMPTGGGKTRAGMAFALKHVLEHGLDRVIVAIPYTSIIEQNVAVYREIFGHGPVLEHHSAAQVSEDDVLSRERLAAQNWDAPIVVTTTVQLFESLFHNRSSRCRKLHNIAGSVLILDEVQTIPLHLLDAILDVLQELTEHYRLSVVLCTATQPAFEGRTPYLAGFTSVQEIVPEPERYFVALQRVKYSFPEEPWTWNHVADEMRKHPQCLAVVNTRKDALSLLDALDDPGALHLSTLLCGHHRREVLREVRQRLATGLPCRLVSTQVVEAGCDLDFPAVFRAMGPLDRIVQAAGRCNREGEISQLGEMTVFRPDAGRAPGGAYKTATMEAENLLRQDIDLHNPDVFRRYFSSLYQDVDTDRHGIQRLRGRLDFQKVAEKFRMIEQDTAPVIVHYHGHQERIEGLMTQVRHAGFISRAVWQKLQPYTVNVYRRDIERYRSNGLCEPTEFGIDLWRGDYDSVRGIRDVARDPADLFV